ncbi:MAG: hypothetical protein R3C14_06885 [Caldilineaceae bacterium]
MPIDFTPTDVQTDDNQQLVARLAELENQVRQLAKVQRFSESDLLDALKMAKPGERLEFGEVSPYQMEAAVRKLSVPAGAQNSDQQNGVIARDPIDLGNHVSQVSYWWGVRVEVDHEGMQALAAGGAATATLLTAIGVTALVAGIIAGVIGIWSAFDRGNGVIFFVTWSGVHWFTPR